MQPPDQPQQPFYPPQPQTPPPPPTSSYAPTTPGQFNWQAPPPPPKQPGGLRRFASWYKRQNRFMQIIVGIVILACVIFVGSAAVAGIADSGQSPATPTAAVADQPTATSAPTQAPTPTNTPTVKQSIIQIVDSHASQATKIDFPANDGKTVIVQITLSEMATPGFARDAIQTNCFDIEQALWTAQIASLKDVNLAFRGPSVDKFGNKSTSPYGQCDLTKATAAKFNWSNLDSASAWQAYDTAMFYTIIAG